MVNAYEESSTSSMEINFFEDDFDDDFQILEVDEELNEVSDDICENVGTLLLWIHKR